MGKNEGLLREVRNKVSNEATLKAKWSLQTTQNFQLQHNISHDVNEEKKVRIQQFDGRQVWANIYLNNFFVFVFLAKKREPVKRKNL